MGQRHSTIILRPKLPFIWVLRCERLAKRGRRQRVFADNAGMNCNGPNCKRRDSKKGQSVVNKEEANTKKRAQSNIRICTDRFDCQEKRIVHEFCHHPASMKKFTDISHENSYFDCRKSTARDSLGAHDKPMKRALSEPTLERRGSTSTVDATADRRNYCSRRGKWISKPLINGNSSSGSSKSNSYETAANTFGYAIADLDVLLMQASIEKPANIPVVLSFPSVLYQTQGGIQNEMSLPLGTVANAIFKNQAWLYVQTPHGHEGYVGCSSCLPLGILPQPEKKAPCWEDPTDIFPRPLGNMGNMGNTGDARGASSEYDYHRKNTSPVRVSMSKVKYIARVDGRGPRNTTLPGNNTGEQNVDRLYLEAIAAEHLPYMPPTLPKDFIICDDLFFNRFQ